MLNTQVLTKLAKEISNEIKGDWLIFGGSSLYLLGVESRATTDVDIASFHNSTNQETLQLMTIAADFNLPVEVINQAGSFFLNKIENWQNRCQLFCKGKLGKIYIPEFDLYIELKSARMSESDLSDCLAYLKWTKENKKSFDQETALQKLRQTQLKSNAEQKVRMQQLVREISLTNSDNKP